MITKEMVEAAKQTLLKPHIDVDFGIYGGDDDDDLGVRDDDDNITYAIATGLHELPGCCGVRVLNGFKTGPYSPKHLAATVLVIDDIKKGLIIATTNKDQLNAEKALMGFGFTWTPFIGNNGPLKLWQYQAGEAPVAPKKRTVVKKAVPTRRRR